MMFKSLMVFMAAALVAACAPQAASPTPTPAPTLAATPSMSQQDAIDLAEAFFQSLVVDQDFAGATQNFDATMKAVLPESQLKATWEKVVEQAGAYQGRLDPQTETQDQYIRVIIPLKFEQAILDMRVVIDSTSGQIAGLFFAPSQTASEQLYQAPAYADESRFDEREVTIGQGEWELPGTLALPKGDGPFPAVVLVHGSGPNDRDESIGANKPFKDIAWGLASRGIAVLRYDKRTKVYPQKMATLADLTVKEEVIDDALAAASLLRQTEGIDADRIFVLGHSLGGMLAPRIAQADADIAGAIILAGPTRPLEDLFVEQSEYILGVDGDISASDQKQIDTVRQQVEAIKALDPAQSDSGESILGAPASYWLDLRGYSPAEVAAQLARPIFVLQGERDYQVTLKDFAGWQAALANTANAQLKTYADLNHLFIAGTGPSTPNEYQTPGHVAETVIDDLAGWIDQQP